MNVPVRIISRRVNYPLRNNPYSRFKYQWGIDRIIAVSDSIKETLVAHGINPRIIDTVHEGIDVGAFDAVPASPERFFPQGTFIIGTLAYLSEEKGLTYLVEAAAKVLRVHPSARFVLVGEGPLRKQLEQQARNLGLGSSLLFTGFREDVASILKTFNAFVLPSLSEGFPTVILYAMAASLPVVATRVGGLPELVLDGITGYLAPPADGAALAESLSRLLEDPQASLALGQAGRGRVETVFNLNNKINETLMIYRNTFTNNTNSLRVA
jgi:glycosyltransferase involved in cell wall biosynthesis